MHKALGALLAIAAFTPAAAVAAPAPGHHHARNVARAQCNAERKLLGVPAFRNKYGAPNAYRNCVRARLPGNRAAATQCRAERAQIGPPAFRQKYGGPVPLNRCIKELTTP